MENGVFTGGLTEEAYRDWIRPQDAILRLAPRHPDSIKKTIQGRVAAGRLLLGFECLTDLTQHNRPNWVHAILKPNRWLDKADDRFWDFGDFEATTTDEDTQEIGRYYIQGVRFEPIGFAKLEDQLRRPAVLSPPAILQMSPTQRALSTSERRKDADATPLDKDAHFKGRPSKVFWDELWAAMAIQLYSGDLQPQRQADIERAMADWISANNHSATESGVRERAKTLWRAWAAEKAKN